MALYRGINPCGLDPAWLNQLVLIFVPPRELPLGGSSLNECRRALLTIKAVRAERQRLGLALPLILVARWNG
jgi:hypothetical protein